MRPIRRPLANLVPLLVFGLAVVPFVPALTAGFVWDDELVVTDNYDFRGLDTERLAWMWTTSRAGHYHPLTWLSLAFDHARHGLEPAGYHATNLVLHGLVAVALYLLALELLSRAMGLRRESRAPALVLAAAAAAGLHAVHPMRCESVCWVTERRDVLSGLFLVLAAHAYLRGTPSGVPVAWRDRALWGSVAASGLAVASFFASVSFSSPDALALRGWGLPGVGVSAGLLGVAVLVGARTSTGSPTWRGATVLLVALSLGAKAWGMVAFAVFLVVDLYPLRRLPPTGRAAAALRLLAEKAPLVALSVVAARLASWAQGAQQGSLDVWALHGPGQRIAQAAYGLLFYPVSTLLPFWRTPLVHVPDDLSLTEPRFLLALVAVLALTAVLVLNARRRPALLATWVAYAVIVSPVLGFAQAGPQLVADRYGYLSCIPFALLAGAGLGVWCRESPGRLPVAAGIAGVAVLALAVSSAAYSRAWRSDAELWAHALSVNPDAPQAILNFGVSRVALAEEAASDAEREALYAEAESAFARGGTLRPGSYSYPLNRAAMRRLRARALPPEEEPLRAQLLAEARVLAERAIEIAQGAGLRDPQLQFQYGLVLREQARLPEAIAALEEAVRVAPRFPTVRVELASALISRAQAIGQADPARALEHLERANLELDRALAIDPSRIEPRFLSGAAFELRARVHAYLGQGSEAAALRARAARAYAAIPSDSELGRRASERIRALDSAQ